MQITRISHILRYNSAGRRGKDVAIINSPITAHPVEVASPLTPKWLSAKQKNVLRACKKIIVQELAK